MRSCVGTTSARPRISQLKYQQPAQTERVWLAEGLLHGSVLTLYLNCLACLTRFIFFVLFCFVPLVLPFVSSLACIASVYASFRVQLSAVHFYLVYAWLIAHHGLHQIHWKPVLVLVSSRRFTAFCGARRARIGVGGLGTSSVRV